MDERALILAYIRQKMALYAPAGRNALLEEVLEGIENCDHIPDSPEAHAHDA